MPQLEFTPRKNFVFIPLIVLPLLGFSPWIGFASDIEVDQNNPGALYQTIQDGLDAALEGQEVCVHPGTYIESVTLEKTVTLRALEGPALTVIQSSTPGTSLPGVTITNGASPKIIGFQIREFHNGIEIQSDGEDILIANNIIAWNGNYGIAMGGETATTTAIINVTFANQTNEAIHTSGLSIDLVNCYNCLFYKNDETSSQQWDSSVHLIGGYHLSDRNIFVSALATGPSFLNNADPLIDPLDAYRFTSDSSPAIDAGRPTQKDRDPDGSIADIGAWGGRYSRGWYRGPTGGPTLQDVSLSKQQVQLGETITIRATAITD
ncbi:MAG: right-handed parallel beta-helix repeat-containing protein [Candidatus Omnitrophica bacterium]|nr:right-handed parallel beta-helix repeat-containing protein [Candidatus Omnitrophota bacterium]